MKTGCRGKVPVIAFLLAASALAAPAGAGTGENPAAPGGYKALTLFTGLDPAGLRRIRFVFDLSKEGTLALDEVGVRME